MKKIFIIISLLVICFLSKAQYQVPRGYSLKNGSYYNYNAPSGMVLFDSLIMMRTASDTLMLSLYPAIKYFNFGTDSGWFYTHGNYQGWTKFGSGSGGGTTWDASLIAQGSTPMSGSYNVNFDGNDLRFSNINRFQLNTASYPLGIFSAIDQSVSIGDVDNLTTALVVDPSIGTITATGTDLTGTFSNSITLHSTNTLTLFSEAFDYVMPLQDDSNIGFIMTQNGADAVLKSTFSAVADSLAPYIFTNASITWSVLDSLNTPPVSPTTGDIYEVGTSPTGVFIGHVGSIATFGGVSWTFQVPTVGDLLYNAATDFVSRWSGSVWVRVGKASFHQGTDRFGANAKIGTGDNFAFGIWTNGVQRFNIANNGVTRIYNLSGSTTTQLVGATANGTLNGISVSTGLSLVANVLTSTYTTPTWQNALDATSGSTLTHTNTIVGGSHAFYFTGMNIGMNTTTDSAAILNIGISSAGQGLRLDNARITKSVFKIYDNSGGGSGANIATNVDLTDSSGTSVFSLTGRAAIFNYGATNSVTMLDAGLYMGGAGVANGTYMGNRSMVYAGGSYIWANAPTTQTSGTTRMTLATTGALQLNAYGSGTFTGTPTKTLAVDASGNVIETSVSGTGTVTNVTWTGGIVSIANPTTVAAFTIAGTSGGIPYFSSTSTWASSALLAANAIMIGGGAGTAPSTTTTGTGVLTALGINVGSAGAFVTFNGAGGTPSSMVGTNITGTASGLTAGNVTTNANLTGTVTSVGNATSSTITSPVITTGMTASGSASNDFSASTGTFKTSTGANQLSGAVTVTDATTPSITLASGKTNTGFLQINGKTSGAFKIIAADAAAQTVTMNLNAQTTGAGTLNIPDMAGATKTLAWLESPAFTTPDIGTATGTVLAISTQLLTSSSSTTRVYRTTNGGSNVTPLTYFGNPGSVTAGTLGIAYDLTNQLSFTHANGTRNIAGASIQLTNLTNTAASESSDLAFLTQSAGAAEATRLTIGANGNITIANGNLVLSTAGNGLTVTEGSGGKVGQSTLVSGTKAITISGVTTSSRAFIQLVTPSGVTLTTTYQAVCTANTLTVQANVAAGTINTADGSTFNYWIIN